MKTSKITLENYEAYLLDYMEGNLSKDDVALLQQFVVLHPELNIDLSELELVELDVTNEVFENKNQLKKNTTAVISDEDYVNYIENNLSVAEKNTIDSLASQHPSVKRDLNLFQKTILQPELNIVFENKSDLKKEAKVIWLFSRQTLSMAAALLLLVTFVFIFRFFNVENNNGQELSEVKVLNNENTASVDSNKGNENKTSSVESPVEIEKSAKSENATLANVREKKNNNATVVSSSTNAPTTEVLVNNNTLTVPENTTTIALTNNATKEKINSTDIIPSAETKTKKAYIITEQAFDEDEKALAANTEKKGLFDRARKALKNLNKMGVKTLNATENVHGDTEEYTLSVGNFTVYKNKFN